MKSHYLFEKAENKIMGELNVVRIVKALRKFKMLTQAMLSQRHRLLLRFQKQNMIETSSSSSDSDDNIYDPVRLIDHPNHFVRLVQLGKVKKMMTQFTQAPLNPLEQNMLRGLFQRHLKDFSERQREFWKDGATNTILR